MIQQPSIIDEEHHYTDTSYSSVNSKLGFIAFLNRKWKHEENRFFVQCNSAGAFIAIDRENYISVCPYYKNQSKLEALLQENASSLLDFYQEALAETMNLFQKNTFEITDLFGKDESKNQHVDRTICDAVNSINGNWLSGSSPAFPELPHQESGNTTKQENSIGKRVRIFFGLNQ
jgi:hypothetical protein